MRIQRDLRNGQRVVVVGELEIPPCQFGVKIPRAGPLPAAPESQIGPAADAGYRPALAEAGGRDIAGFDINIAPPVGCQEIALGIQPEKQPPAPGRLGRAIDPGALADRFKRQSGVGEQDRRPPAFCVTKAEPGVIEHDIFLSQQPGRQGAVFGGDRAIPPAAPDGDPPVPPTRQIKRQPA